MKNEYISAELEIVMFEQVDVIATSGGGISLPDDEWN